MFYRKTHFSSGVCSHEGHQKTSRGTNRKGKAKLQEFCLQQLQNTKSRACDVVRAHRLCSKAGLEPLGSPSTAVGTVGWLCSQGGAGAPQGQQGWRDITHRGDTVLGQGAKPDRRRSQQTQEKQGVEPRRAE